MIEAIRNLGILKMINEFEEFDFNALESVDSFLKERENAIESGTYARLQFESLNSEHIGIFTIDGETIKFIIDELVSEDSWKYLFIKTASQGTYIAPTWKDSQSKLEKTVKRYIENSIENDQDWLQNVVRIFTSDDIEIGKLKDDGTLERKSFLETVEWAKETKKISVFSVRINGKYNAEIRELLDFSLNEKPKAIYQTNDALSFKSSGVGCSLCHIETELFPNVLSRDGVGINIGNVDKFGFFPGVTRKNAGKAFPICAPCAEALYAAKFHVFQDLRQNISGHQALIIPHLLESGDKEEDLDIITTELKRLLKDVGGAERTEYGILKDLSENKGVSTVTFIIGEVGGQSVENIRKVIPDVLPSRLSDISQAIEDINKVNDGYSPNHPWKKSKYPPLNGNLRIVKDVLGLPKYIQQKGGGGRKPFKSSSIDTLNLLNAIFLNKTYPLKDILSEFSSKLSYDLLGALSNEDKNQPIYSIRNNITNMVYLLSFLNRLEIIRMNSGNNFVKKYLERHEGLKPLNSFLSTEAKGLDTKEKQYTFLVGLLFGKLISFQQRRGVATSGLKWLKGLQLSSADLMEIFVKTRGKLDDYSTPRSAWSEEMRGVAEAIGALGADIEEWSISRKEIPYYLCLGQSLSGYYLPGKNGDEQSVNHEELNGNE
ncbi:MAG: TM1802 family CRISPR-associated protein [ANME-2 cluster archaeon]|nr:TM1802 family CRISPR-associated protein [ANME-2 cluster archaeon]